MSSPTSLPRPTPKQLSFLRSLAGRTGTTFVTPRTRQDASVEIARLLKLSRRRRSRDFAEFDRRPAPLYGTAPQPDEMTGYGSSAHWRTTRLKDPEAPSGEPTVGEPVEQARYRISAGERVILGQRILGRVRLVDKPACGKGRSYLIERELQRDGLAALQALIADYLTQARELDAIPAAVGALSLEAAASAAA
jgi:hypothetical protein